MKNIRMIFSLVLLPVAFSCADKADPGEGSVSSGIVSVPENAYVLTEQASTSIIIADAETGKKVWEWDPWSAQIPDEYIGWFDNPSEVKPVCNRKYVLMTASGGAVALIRISDSKLMFYAYCGSNPHSAELLPDGNIVTAESRGGQINLFVTDTLKVLGTLVRGTTIGNAHNVVWDRRNECLFLTGTISSGVSALFRFDYNGDRKNPALLNQTRVYTFEEESGGHDLFPVYGEEGLLWFTAASAVYQFDVTDPFAPSCEKIYSLPDIKSISNGPEGIVMISPTEEWWSDALTDEEGSIVFRQEGAEFYKGRWMLDNTFSYPEVHNLEFPE